MHTTTGADTPPTSPPSRRWLWSVILLAGIAAFSFYQCTQTWYSMTVDRDVTVAASNGSRYAIDAGRPIELDARQIAVKSTADTSYVANELGALHRASSNLPSTVAGWPTFAMLTGAAALFGAVGMRRKSFMWSLAALAAAGFAYMQNVMFRQAVEPDTSAVELTVVRYNVVDSSATTIVAAAAIISVGVIVFGIKRLLTIADFVLGKTDEQPDSLPALALLGGRRGLLSNVLRGPAASSDSDTRKGR